MMSDFVLTDDNYYSQDADIAYVSVSQYKDCFGFGLHERGCEMRMMEKLRGNYKPEMTESMMMGSIVDSLYEGSFDRLVAEHPEIISSRGATKGQLKSNYQRAFALYQRSQKDPLFAKFMSGEKQVIETGEIEGIPVKIKMDSLHDGICIVDLKVIKDIHQSFYIADSGERVSFIEKWKYPLQLAVYQEIHRQATGDKLKCYICAIDKTPVPDLAVIEIPQTELDKSLVEFKQNIEHLQMLKDGTIEPIRCEMCDYCKETKILTDVVTSDQLIIDAY